MELTQELVKSLFDYHEDGYLVWRNIKHSKKKAGERAGSLHIMSSGNRYRVKIYYKEYKVSRIIFLWHKGYLPMEVDHKDNNSLNDKIKNLRAADRLLNAKNRTASKNRASKYLGVYFHKVSKKWYSQIRIQGKNKHLGLFINEKEAALAYNKAAIIYYGEFANPNKF